MDANNEALPASSGGEEAPDASLAALPASQFAMQLAAAATYRERGAECMRTERLGKAVYWLQLARHNAMQPAKSRLPPVGLGFGGSAGEGAGTAMDAVMPGLGGSACSDAEHASAVSLFVAVCNNLAHCYLQREEWGRAIDAATDAALVDPLCAKAFYRRGVAWVRRGNAEKGVADLRCALELCQAAGAAAVDSAAVEEKLRWAEACVRAERDAARAALRRAFASASETTAQGPLPEREAA